MANTRPYRALIAAVIAVGASLVATTSAATKPQEAVTVRLLGNTAGQVAQDILIANFERVYPNINVEATYVDPGSYPTLLLTQLQAGNAPDVITTNTGNATPVSIWPLAQAGRLLDLTGRKWQGRIYKPVREYVSYKTKVYGWPLQMNPHGVAYNIDLFRELNLRVPTTFNQFLNLCRTIKAAGKVPVALGVTGGQTGSVVLLQQRMNNYVYNQIPSWNARRASGSTTFASTPQWKRAIQSIVDMKDAGCFNAAPQGTTFTGQITMFARGEALMSVLAGSLNPNVEQINPKLNYAYFNLPPDTASQAAASVAVATSLSINATTKVPGAARTFIDFMARPKQLSLYAKVAGGINPYDAERGVLPNYLKSMTSLFKAGKVVSTPQNGWPNPNLLFGGFYPGITGLFTGQLTVDNVLARADYMWENPTATTAP